MSTSNARPSLTVTRKSRSAAGSGRPVSGSIAPAAWCTPRPWLKSARRVCVENDLIPSSDAVVPPTSSIDIEVPESSLRTLNRLPSSEISTRAPIPAAATAFWKS